MHIFAVKTIEYGNSECVISQLCSKLVTDSILLSLYIQKTHRWFLTQLSQRLQLVHDNQKLHNLSSGYPCSA